MIIIKNLLIHQKPRKLAITSLILMTLLLDSEAVL